MNEHHKQLLRLLRRFNLVKGEGCKVINAETYADLDQHGWVEQDGERGVFITNKGLDDLKEAEDNPR